MACAASFCVIAQLSGGLALLASPAAAQSRPVEGERQIARDLFERGKAKWTAGEYEEAAGLLAASNQQVSRAGTLMLLADTYQRLGRLRSARDCFRQASQAARVSGDDELQHRADTREAALLPLLPQLEVRVAPPMPSGLLVTLNGMEMPAAELNVAAAIDAGLYRLEARAPGYQTFSVQLQLTNSGPQPLGVRVVPVQLEPERALAPAAEAPTGVEAVSSGGEAEASGGGDTLAGWVGGAGGALVVASIVSMIVSLNKKSDANGACGENARFPYQDEDACTPGGADLRKQARLFANLATVGGVLGVAGVSTGLALYFTAAGSDEPEAAWVSWSAAF